jgi:hypothetical protein
MRIIVPTRGRVGRQATLTYMAPHVRRNAVVVCPASEIEEHRRHSPWRDEVEYIAQPDPDMTIAKKREWIFQNYKDFTDDGCILMLDDDLRTYHRRDDNPQYLRYSNDDDQERYFWEIGEILRTGWPHAGFGVRQGNNRWEAGWHSPGRMMLALGYHVPTLLENAELGRIETREDFDYTLQLLRKGIPNAVCQTFVVGQHGYNEQGGASLERTLERSNRDARLLAQLHPGYVTVVEKEYKSNPRLEVICRWQKALADGKQWRLSQTLSGQAGGQFGPDTVPLGTG